MISKKIAPLLVGSCIFALFFYAELTPNQYIRTLVTRLQHIAYDARLWSIVHTHQHALKDRRIVIIDIDEKSLQQEGHWPWPRNKLAVLTQKLLAQGATVIAFDILFSEPTHNLLTRLADTLPSDIPQRASIANYLKTQAQQHDYDQQFAKQLAQGDTVLGFVLHNTPQPSQGRIRTPTLYTSKNTQSIPAMQQYISNITPLQDATHSSGFTSTLPDKDGVIRRSPLLLRYQNGLYPALALEAIRRYLLIDQIHIDTGTIGNKTIIHALRLGHTRIPTDGNSRMLIPFLGAMHSFPYYSATDVLHNRLPPLALQGKLIFIGTSAFGLGDTHTTPLQNTTYPGVEVHANIAHALLTQRFLYTPAWSRGTEIAVLLVVGLIGTLFLPLLSPLWMLLTTLLSIGMLITTNTLLWTLEGWVLPEAIIPIALLLTLLMFNTLYAFLFEERQRKRLKTLFGRYVPNSHIDTMLRSQHQFSLEGETKEMSVLFADIQNFTSCCEHLSAAQIKSMLNTLLTPLTKIIFDQSGTIDKYIGDMVMAFWGAPLPDPAHPEHAVLSALKMTTALKHMEDQWTQWNIPPLRMGIGINTGPMHIGDMGSEYRLAYTVLGDAVNLASRLEGLTRHYHIPIIVSESTQKATTGILYRPLDRVAVKGKEEIVAIYEPLCTTTSTTYTALQEKVLQHTQALTAYFTQAWTTAQTLFTQLADQFPEDKALYQCYLERISLFQQHPPPSDWDGVYHLTTK